MAGAVEGALLDIIAEGIGGEGAADAAKGYLQKLSDCGRYERDVWFS
jgi:sulfite reductase alpha subunit-like flavoprotein